MIRRRTVAVKPGYVEIHRYIINKILCRHHKSYRRLLFSSNGAEAYCSKCYRKHTAIYDFRPERYKS